VRLWDVIGAPSPSFQPSPSQSASLWPTLSSETQLYIISAISKVEAAIGFWKYMDALDKEGTPVFGRLKM
jgi:hypothetical protein